ncbi:NAD(P)H-dependent amine dehydrogenase family protein [Sanguibacter suarezii]|uniref:NAD(P)H-dependent amine dehydrogenase family protein n=1 Tax=Sanguibacter suarezii TaxID=60921 RepID=UPI000A9CB3DA|nr:hypothetical protein [Sanguibacter suarezii]
MSTRPVRVVIYGCGNMARVITGYLVDKGAEIVGAIDTDPALVGRDLGEVAGLTEPLGVTISDNAEGVLDATIPDVVVLTLLSLMTDMEPFFEDCASRGINAVSTCEEAFFPWNTSPEITARLDELARRNDCTLLGTGYQDVFWGSLVTATAGATHRIDTIRGYSTYNVDDYGIALAQVHGVGLDLATFDAEIRAAALPSFALNVPPWLAGALGLDVSSMTQELEPIFASGAITSRTLGRELPPHEVIGMLARATAETVQGPTLIMEVVGKVYGPRDVDHNDWIIEGEPRTELVVTEPKTVELTCATTVNRIPQVIDAPAGFITGDQLGPVAYLTGPLTTSLGID